MQRGLIHLLFDPAVFEQLIEHPHRLFAAGAEAAFGKFVGVIVIVAIGQCRGAYQRFLKDFQ